MTLKLIPGAGCMVLVLGMLFPASAVLFPAFANEAVDSLNGTPALDDAQMGDVRSGRSTRHWTRRSVPAEPKPSKVGRILLPEFEKYPDGTRFGGAYLRPGTLREADGRDVP